MTTTATIARGVRATGAGRILAWSAAALASAAVVCAMPARADPLGQVPGYDDPQPSFGWQGAFQQRELYFPSPRTHTSLYATVYAPAHPGNRRYPVIVILPGSEIGVQAQYGWAARDLAGHGYLTLTIDEQAAGRSGEDAQHPCGPGPPSPQCADQNKASEAAYVDALESGIDFMLSPADPFYANADTSEVGAAGHSAGADLISFYQAIDRRIKAIVAWDNLISSPTGDEGNANCGRKPTTLIKPLVPALGEASETCVGGPTTLPADGKKIGYERWRSQHEPTMETVFAGVQHLQFAQEDNVDAGLFGGRVSGSETQLHDFEYYTRAWFDLFLRHDQAAATRLLSATVNGRPRQQVLSSRYTSAIYLPELGIDCEHLLACRAPSSLTPTRIRFGRRRLVVAPDGWARVPVSCHGNPGARCDGQLEIIARISRRARVIASRPLHLLAGHAEYIALRLSVPARSALRHHGTIKATLVAFLGTPPRPRQATRQPTALIARSQR